MNGFNRDNANVNRLPLAKVSYAEDPISARIFRWTHLTQNLTLAVGRWAGLNVSISGQSLGIFQGQSTLITINVEEMVREAQCGIGTSDQTTNSLKPKPSLSAIYLYPALAMSYCTQHNTIRRVQVKFHTVSDFNIVHDFLQRVGCPLSRYCRPAGNSNLNSNSMKNGLAYERLQPASQGLNLNQIPVDSLSNAANVSRFSSQDVLSQSQKPLKAAYDNRLSTDPKAEAASNFSCHPSSCNAIYMQGPGVQKISYHHPGQNNSISSTARPTIIDYNTSGAAQIGPPSTAPPDLSYSYQRRNDNYTLQTFASTTEENNPSQQTMNIRNALQPQKYVHQLDQSYHHAKGSQAGISADASQDETVPPRRELPWLKPRPHSSAADLPALPTPQYAGKETKRVADAATNTRSTPNKKRTTTSKATLATPLKRQAGKRKIEKQDGGKKRELEGDKDKLQSKAPKKASNSQASTEALSLKKQQQNSKSFKDASTSTEKPQGSELFKNASTNTDKPQAPNPYKDASTSTERSPKSELYKDASTNTEKQNVVDRIYNLCNRNSFEDDGIDAKLSDLAEHAHQPAGERAAVVNHMIAEVLYDPYLVTLCNDIQTYVKDLAAGP